MPTFLPRLETSPFPYDQCPFLKAAEPPFTFAGLAYRVMMFSRESIVNCGARILWGDFQAPSGGGGASWRKEWTRTWAAPLVTMGLMYGQPAGTGGAVVTVHEFLNLAWELFRLPGMHASDSAEADGERAAITVRLANSRLRAVALEKAIPTARVVWNLSHAMGQMAADADSDFATLARDWAIYDRLRMNTAGTPITTSWNLSDACF